jgi:hypothetical protein
MELNAELIMRLHVTISEPLIVGKTLRGTLAIIPITGGTFEGPHIRGRVCLGGADWNTRISDSFSHVFAKYWLQTDDGEYMSIENEGLIDNTKALETVIKTNPRFEVNGKGKYKFLESGVYTGELTGGKIPGSVDITIYKMK